MLGSVVFLIASFLPWYRVDLVLGRTDLTAWDDPGGAWSVTAVAIVVLLDGLLITQEGERRPGGWLPALALGPLACVAFKYLGDSDYIAYGFYVAIAAAILVAIGGIWLLFEAVHSGVR